MGIGMVLMLRPGDADRAVAHFRRAGVPAAVIGEVRKGRRREPAVVFAGGKR
jgi:phosphoribosylaminoimidazole (AIR) synthetase